MLFLNETNRSFLYINIFGEMRPPWGNGEMALFLLANESTNTVTLVLHTEGRAFCSVSISEENRMVHLLFDLFY